MRRIAILIGALSMGVGGMFNRHGDDVERSSLSVEGCPWWSEEVDALY